MKKLGQLRDVATEAANILVKYCDDPVEMEFVAYILLRRTQRTIDKGTLNVPFDKIERIK